VITVILLGTWSVSLRGWRKSGMEIKQLEGFSSFLIPFNNSGVNMFNSIFAEFLTELQS
jgi:hypothetical protein